MSKNKGIIKAVNLNSMDNLSVEELESRIEFVMLGGIMDPNNGPDIGCDMNSKPCVDAPCPPQMTCDNVTCELHEYPCPPQMLPY